LLNFPSVHYSPNRLFIYISLFGSLTLSGSLTPLFGGESPESDRREPFLAEEVTVTAARPPIFASELSRTVRVISREEIERAPVASIADLLGYVLGADLQTRGPNGAQSDLSLRGASYEQTLVLVDGVRLSDPQTGHHQLNLPFGVSDIERVEVLYGHGSRLYGPGALGGVVNIITRRGSGKSASVKLEAGDFHLLRGEATASAPAWGLQHSVSVIRQTSGDYIRSSELDLRGASYRTSGTFGKHTLSLSTGWQDKRFGAATFYSAAFPLQWEATETRFVSLKDEWQHNGWMLSPRISWRGHSDEYLLDRTRPTFYRNYHETDVYEAELSAGRTSKLGVTSASVEYGEENMTSTSLHNHNRTRWGASVEQRLVNLGKFDVTVGAAGYGYSDWGFKLYPGVDVGCQIAQSFRVFATAGGAFRPPTFTDLYYDSPANKGNPNLKPESATSWETGAAWDAAGQRATLSYFHRSGRDVIDWARALPADPWRVMNIAKLETDGVEGNYVVNPSIWLGKSPFERFEAGVSYISSARDFQGLTSKYALAYPRKQATLRVDHRLPWGVTASWFERYKQRLGGKGYAVTDLKTSRQFGAWEYSLSATNLFDQPYQEVAGVPMPGRWVKAGVEFKI